ncbi:Root meristem growth factor 9 [Senna tora]|uniref:Root meristem growth factor 9 n=1 Tax=Senna tora TaxID=362788 RepID=A0A834X988_9FABA|nr:Root meristem growth factor 9 [Senna tora]
MLSSRRILLVAFLLICFFSISASGRSLREKSKNYNGVGEEKVQKQNSNMFKANKHGGEEANGSDDLVTMDYTPAKKNPPIHN